MKWQLKKQDVHFGDTLELPTKRGTFSFSESSLKIQTTKLNHIVIGKVRLVHTRGLSTGYFQENYDRI